MSDLSSRPATRAEELRLAFDRGFAAAPSVDGAVSEDLLGIRLGPAAHALRLSEIGGIFADKKVTRVPAPVPTLLGIASFRGAVMPVYDLPQLLGFPASATPRWMITTATAPIALAFESFEGHLRISRDAIAPHGAGHGTRSHVREFARAANDTHAIIDLASVIELVKTRVEQANS